ncbi:right-handed parallel beta-helix repeat-containing protein [Flammeovirga sp. SubArs3]|uniref:right-handed parallel beta-helix repeat-containing protein n=1 Tax=Flammeovirga sp. SubArs3 TaxID=2995316 RepID=UPI00248B3D95|nr:right-handed parallel beta-helix repeat-containing protein [Flammeovirga sp. SubArs3]
MKIYKLILFCVGLLLMNCTTQKEQTSTAYYFDTIVGDDLNDGTKTSPFKSLEKIKSLQLEAGDSILFKSGQTFEGGVVLEFLGKDWQIPLVITSTEKEKATIDAKGGTHALYINSCSNIKATNLRLVGNAGKVDEEEAMRCGVLYTITKAGDFENITFKDLEVEDIFYNQPGIERGAKEVNTANGTQKYGWGIRAILKNKNSTLHNLLIEDCHVRNVAHTGIKLTGNANVGIENFVIKNCVVEYTGGPGIQMSRVKKGHVYNNIVDHSGSDDDSRKWGRGSGLWTWGSDSILIEKNRLTNANGPGDSAGAHIDYNCNNIVLQYNYSQNNAGGFIEVLGNNYNCSYRYNVSVNDGYRTKGEDGAFQEGKVFWLSGYQGNKKRKGPFNTYIYNNTIYLDNKITAKIAVDKATKGVFIANNIFHFEGDAKLVLGDQYTPDKGGDSEVENITFKNNIFYSRSNWPKEVLIQPNQSKYADVHFANVKGSSIEDFIPHNSKEIKQKGIRIQTIQQDSIGLIYGLEVSEDILGNPISEIPSIGAIEIM